MMPRKRKNEPLNKYLVFINVAFQMALIIGGGVFTGIWLDNKFSNDFPVFTVSLSLLGVFIALYQVISAVKDLDGEE